jgi:predicted RNA-binding Zn-ribbon protein involved in translation (DUF1610 family)
MDITTVTGAYEGLKAAKEIIGSLLETKIDIEVKAKIIEIQNKLGETQDTLFGLREELFKLQEANYKLNKELESIQSWQAKVDQYELSKTNGGAVVYKFKGQPEHFACPSCFNSKQVHILQTNRTFSGKYRCTGCGNEFPIEPKEKLDINVNR